jgi:multiple sugar transport system ATP-binding protein
VAEIVLDGVTKRFPDGTEAVKALDLDVADGEFMVFVGPSGCGKSTALNMIAGLEDISDGELRIDGKVVNNLTPKDRDIAMVFQSYALYPHMTVRDNMSFALKLAKVPGDEIRKRVDEAAGMLELSEYLDRKPANLSGGQRQRVAMGRAIVRSPKAFLMDEPLSNLDAKLRVQMRTSIARLQQRLGTTTIYVTHDQTEAMTLGDRILVLRGGVMQQVGTPQELYDTPNTLFVAGFIGSPAMNFLAGRLDEGALHTPLGELPLDGELGHRLEQHKGHGDVVVGLRPEHFEDASLVEVEKREQGATVKVNAEVIESMGSDVFAYFSIPDADASGIGLGSAEAEAAADIPETGESLVARLNPATKVREGSTIDLWYDPTKLQLFDPKTGGALGR